jgi:hybrid cluster-associated redox disulfide protein
MFTKDTPIVDVLRLYPEAREVLTKRGMACIGCMGAANETIENAARAHDIDVESLLTELNRLEKAE